MIARISTTDQARQIRRGITLARRGNRNPWKPAIHVQDVYIRAFTALEARAYAVTSNKLRKTRRPPPGPPPFLTGRTRSRRSWMWRRGTALQPHEHRVDRSAERRAAHDAEVWDAGVIAAYAGVIMRQNAHDVKRTNPFRPTSGSPATPGGES